MSMTIRVWPHEDSYGDETGRWNIALETSNKSKGWPEDLDIVNSLGYTKLCVKHLSDVRDTMLEMLDNYQWKVWYANVYLSDQAYGGPEEGGWYYATHQFQQEMSRLVSGQNPEAAFAAIREIKARVDAANEGRPAISSVNSIGRYRLHVEYMRGQNSPAIRPQYC